MTLPELDPQRACAVTGVGAVLPGSRDTAGFWENLLARRDCVREIPDDRLPPAFVDPDLDADDRSYCRVGGVVDEIPFDPRIFRMTPLAERSTDRLQKLALAAAREAFLDAGLERSPIDGARVGVVLGNASGRTEAETRAAWRVQQPLVREAARAELSRAGIVDASIDAVLAELDERLLEDLPPLTEDSLPGLLANVAAGRIASAFDLHGPSCVVDSACASSLAALDLALDWLAREDCDAVLVGGCHALLDPMIMVGFSKFRGLSTTRAYSFDARADGFVVGEGAAVLVLKRLADALRDGDRVYAVVRGVGASSDGRATSLAAPNPRAQALAMRRALAVAGYEADTLQYVETHGAGTPVGDPAEIEAMLEAFGASLAGGRRIRLGAVKSHVGHLMGAAGAAGLLATVLGLHHRTMAPVRDFAQPSPSIPWDEVPFDVVAEACPWPANADGLPRRGNVSSFGFGGTNFHAALEAFDAAYHRASRRARTGAAPGSPPPGEPIAILGVAAVLPDAPAAEAFWANVLEGRYSIGGAPEGHAAGSVASDVLGAFVREPPFDGQAFRVPPASAARLDPAQRRFLACAATALADAGLDPADYEPDETAVVLGDSGGCQQSAWAGALTLNGVRAGAALASSKALAALGHDADGRAALGQAVHAALRGDRPPINEDTIYSICSQIGPARLSKALDLKGPHVAVDAACASGLAAVAAAVSALRAGRTSLAIVGASSSGITPTVHEVFARAGILSTSSSRPLSSEADGIVVGEGTTAFVLKRLRDAIADGDRVRAVIRGVGAASDGRGKGMMAPNADGQELALRRAYADAGCAPESVQVVECHATSTEVGDAVEIEAMRRVFAGQPLHVGSVKSQIGHLIGGAGGAGLLKTVLALGERTLPPTRLDGRPLEELAASSFAPVGAPAPWPENDGGEPRRAGVSAFGFGGTDFHVVVEEYEPAYHAALLGQPVAQPARPAEAPVAVGPELVLVGGTTLDDALGRLDALVRRVGQAPGDAPDELRTARLAAAAEQWRIGFGASDPAELADRAAIARQELRRPRRSPRLDAAGIFAGERAADPGRVACLFPGQGCQSADLIRDLHERHAVVRETFAEANETLAPLLGGPLEELLFTCEGRPAEAVEADLLRSELAQPAIVAASVALDRLVRSLGVRPDLLAGHSLGEYSALVAGGFLRFGDALRAVHARGLAFRRLAEREGDPGAMAVVSADADRVAAVLAQVDGYVAVANRNCPSQTVVSGETAAVDRAIALLQDAGLTCRRLPIAGAFHSEVARAATPAMAEALAAIEVLDGRLPVLSTVDGAYYLPGDCPPERLRARLVEQLTAPVDFLGTIARLQADGARTYVEVGPRRALTAFVDEILAGEPHVAAAANHVQPGGPETLVRLLARLAVLGLLADPDAAPARPAAPPERAAATPAPSVVEPREPRARRSARRAVERGRARADEAIVVSAVAVGLPGQMHRVFSDDGVDRLLDGQNLVTTIADDDQDRIVDKRIVRLVKSEDGVPRFEQVRDRSGSVKLAGQRGQFSLADYGIEAEHLTRADPAYQLAVAAGLEGLRDAGIPLVREQRRTSTGASLPGGWVLPAALQDSTGVLFASAFPGYHVLVDEVGRYHEDRYAQLAGDGLRARYLERLAAATTSEERLAADRWFAAEQRRLWNGADAEPYRFNPSFLTDLHCMGNTLLAQLVQARGPNFQLNAACSSTTVALAVAHDLLRCGRAERMIVLAADDVTSAPLLEWIAAGFLAAGASATDAAVEDAALPFDARRHGMLLGMGAVCVVLERAGAVDARGMTPIAELLGARCSNSAHHPTRPDAAHAARELDAFLAELEETHGIDRTSLAERLLYLSHETFTPAARGIAQAEVHMLREAFGDAWRRVTVANTKALTGHAQGAGLEDAIAPRALQLGRLPTLPRHVVPDPALDGVNLSRGGDHRLEYALRFSAGFGSQVAMTLVRAVSRTRDRLADPARYGRWVEEVAGRQGAEVEVVDRTLRVRETPAGAARPPRRVDPPAALAGPTETRPAPPAPATPAAEPHPRPVTPAVRTPAVDVPLGPAPVLAVEPAPAPPVPSRWEQVEEAVLAIVSERTGYERELLELDLDLEGDLGIDTIKQAQVIGLLADRFGLSTDGEVRIRDYPTLRHVIAHLVEQLGPGEAPDRQPPAGPAPSPSTAEAHVQPAAVPDAVDRRAEVEEAVLAIVSERTGYERELLELDLDLEGDLGIDTIKQAQVIGLLADRFGLSTDGEVRIRDYPTLRHVIAHLVEQLGPADAPGRPVDATAAAPSAAAHEAVERYELERSLVPLDEERPNGPVLAGRALLVVDGPPAVAAAVVAAVEERGGRAIALRLDGVDAPGEAATRASAGLGGAEGVVFLGALEPPSRLVGLDPPAWREALERAIERPFAVLHALAGELAAASADGRALLVGASAAGGDLGLGEPLAEADGGEAAAALAGGLAGLLKTAAAELPGALVKSVDLPGRLAPETIAETLVEELERGGARVEVGHQAGARWVPRLVRRPLDLSRHRDLDLDQASVVLLVGGGRGATAAIARDLAETLGPTLVLWGASPIPEEAGRVADLDQDGLQELRRRLARERRDRDPHATPLELDQEFRRLERAVETERTLRALHERGANASYAPVDVRDAAAVRSGIDAILAEHARLDVVVFGAGTIDDRLIADKTSASFARVLHTKAVGIANLLTALDGREPAALLAMSSIAGRLGNRGQADYAAANDLLARALARYRLRPSPRKVVSLDWTAWADVGLAARAGVADLMRERGIEPLAPEDGARRLRDELLYGGRAAEVVIVGGLSLLDRDGIVAADAAGPTGTATPFDHLLVHDRGARLVATRTFALDRDPWLRDHLIRGVALLPGVIGIETMARAAALLLPQFHLTGAEDVDLREAITVRPDRPATVVVEATVTAGRDEDTRRVLVRLLPATPPGAGEREQVYHQAVILLDRVARTPPTADPSARSRRLRRGGRPTLYGPSGLLPHGPAFQVVDRLDRVDEDGASASLPHLDGRDRAFGLGRPLTAPLAREAAFQVAGLHGILRHDAFAIPRACRRIEHFGPIPDHVRLRAEAILRNVGPGIVEYDLLVVGDDGHVYDRTSGYRGARLDTAGLP